MRNITGFIFISLLLLGCKKEDPVGPTLTDLYGQFEIVEPLSHNKPDGVDFTKDSVQFKGEWTIVTPWKITIKGKRSGAVKTITGKGKTLDTLVGVWNGTADGIFFKLEECDVKLSFDNQSDIQTSSVKILGKHDYSKDGYIIESFESPITLTGGSYTTLNVRENTLDTIPEGEYYYHLEGTEPGQAATKGPASWFIGALPNPFKAKSTLGKTYFPFKDADTTTVYINFFVYGYGYPNTKILISAPEDDNGDGVFSSTTEDSYGYEYIVTSAGWHKVSIPLSEFSHSIIWIDDVPYKYGNNKKEISKMMEISISLVSDGKIPSPKVGCAIDFFIITKGKPL